MHPHHTFYFQLSIAISMTFILVQNCTLMGLAYGVKRDAEPPDRISIPFEALPNQKPGKDLRIFSLDGDTLEGIYRGINQYTTDDGTPGLFGDERTTRMANEQRHPARTDVSFTVLLLEQEADTLAIGLDQIQGIDRPVKKYGAPIGFFVGLGADILFVLALRNGWLGVGILGDVTGGFSFY